MERTSRLCDTLSQDRRAARRRPFSALFRRRLVGVGGGRRRRGRRRRGRRTGTVRRRLDVTVLQVRLDGVLADLDLDVLVRAGLVAKRDLAGVTLSVCRRRALLRLALVGRRPRNRKRGEDAGDEEAGQERDRFHGFPVGWSRDWGHPSNGPGTSLKREGRPERRPSSTPCVVSLLDLDRCSGLFEL